MVLCLKARESRSPPGPPAYQNNQQNRPQNAYAPIRAVLSSNTNAGWSSPVARQAHNLKAARSNRAPATTDSKPSEAPASRGFFFAPSAADLPSGVAVARFKIVARSPNSSMARPFGAASS